MNASLQTCHVRLFLATIGIALTTSANAQSRTPLSPVVESIMGTPTPDHQAPRVRHAAHPTRRHARAQYRDPGLVARPALAGVVLVEPLQPEIAPPRAIVPLPAYFVDSVVADFTTPPLAAVCERRPRDRALPDPHLYHEVSLVCRYERD